jgi:uncharacterized LabA/DUF88 family protein
MVRVAIFVDGANMFYAQQRHLGWFIDWKRLLDRLTHGKTLYNAFYYTAVNPNRTNDETFYRFLTNAGYTVRRKPLKRIVDPETGTFTDRANLDVEMVVDMFNTLPLYDEAVLCTGDSDFERAVELLRSKGKVITVVGTHGMMSIELRNASDVYVDLADWRESIERAPAAQPSSTPALNHSRSLGITGHARGAARSAEPVQVLEGTGSAEQRP